MKNLTPTLVKILSFVIPVLGAIVLAGIVTYFLGLWGRLPNTPAPSEALINNIRGINNPFSAAPPTPLTALKVGFPYGYKGAPQTYAAKTEAVSIKADFANPSLNENVTKNIEVRVYKFVSIVSNLGNLNKGSVFDEATLRKVWNKEEGSFELDLYPVFSKEFKGTTFGPNETKTIAVDFTPAEGGYYAVIFAEGDYFASNTGDKAVGFIRVTGGNTVGAKPASPATTKGGAALNTATTSATTLPATGGEANLLTVISGFLAALSLKLKSWAKKVK